MNSQPFAWEVINKLGTQHIVPKDDLRPHALTLGCWCEPGIDPDDGMIVIHNAMDRREYVERGQDRVQ